MATAGSPITGFTLNGRRIDRRDGRLTLEDGTLAGADLDMATAIRNVAAVADLDLGAALAMATSIPAALIGRQDGLGHLAPGAPADFVHLTEGGDLASVWRRGRQLDQR